MSQHVYVIGLDDFNLEKLKHLDRFGDYEFHELLSRRRVKAVESGDLTMKQLYDGAREVLRDAAEVDGVVGYWDFPVQTMVPLLCREFELPGPTLESVLRCEHKLWGRLEHTRTVPDITPDFQAFDPFDDDPLAELDMDYPFWVKPIKGTDSLLNFYIENEDDFAAALARIRDEVGALAEPFNYLLEQAKLPPEVAWAKGHTCLAEAPLSGRQHTVSGYVHEGEVTVYGIIDSLNYDDVDAYADYPSFLCYQYPSRLSETVQAEMRRLSAKVMKQLRYDQAAFNIEFFYDETSGELGLLEINPRISQSHGDLYEKVDGAPNHKLMVDLALGHDPALPSGEGGFDYAAKYYLRRFEDARVTRVPSEEEIADVEAKYPGVIVELEVEAGMMLSDLIEQDSYSYELAHIYLGAERRSGLQETFDQVVDLLTFEFA